MANLPVSSLIRQQQGGQMGEDGMEAGKRKSKDEYRKQKDLEEQRKAGTAPAMVDVETGRDINPHIPEFIEKTPWYVPHSGPTLKHQRPHADRQKQLASVTDWYPKGTTDRVAFKYREGACENCGAMGHTKKECFEKPRLVGARWTSTNIAPDDYELPKLAMGWDAKRDRWNGYNPDDYRFVVAEFEKMDETRKLIRAEQLKEAGEEEKLNEDEDIYAEDASAPGQSVDMDSRTRITVRNLRIREDTARYLYNLDPNGPYYDPKSRSMRENPYKNMPGKEKEAAQFDGENFVRFTGEVQEANEAQVFAWQARCKGIDVHSLAEPTRLEALKREFEKQKEANKSSVKNELLEKYGGEEHLDTLPRELLLAQSEQYVEFNRKGKVVKGNERPALRSRYEEDNYINNHTSVWGSYWRDDRWGYACCHQFMRNTYCIGEQGILLEQAELGPPKTLAARLAGAGQTQAKTQPSTGTTKLVPTTAKRTAEDDEKGEKVARKEENEDEAENKSEHSGKEGNSSTDYSENDESEVEELNEEEKQAYEEQLEKEKQKKKREEKKRDSKREKRRRRKERAKQRDKASGANSSKKQRQRSSSSTSSSSAKSGSEKSDSSGDEQLVPAKQKGTEKYSKELRKAIKRQTKQRAEGKKINEMGDRKRKYNRGLDQAADEQNPSEVDKEAYNLTRIHAADPMAKFFEQKDQKKEAKKAKRGGQED